MTARNAATIVSLTLLAFVSGCTNFFEVPIETPISPKMDVAAFRRVLVAGFITGGTDDVDANLETVRLLRSQLRSKSSLRVIEADVLPLAELAADKAKSSPPAPTPESAASASTSEGQTANTPPPQVAPVPALPGPSEPKIRNAKDLEKYQSIFADVAFWKKIGEEYENPLIVTGTVLFTPQQSAGFITRNQESVDQYGRRVVIPSRMYVERKGFALAPKFIFIDGRTGTVLHTEQMHMERLYPTNQNTPALSSYFELMDEVIPTFLGTLSTQKIRGTRVLLR